ncbi:DUF5344 family protein [Bacillus sp. CECT 9360]|uniref:DUF5344 family protein n=1 Tax=Bacillus sp. CECT 9360 TaxID=2845821 RepID=UPI001E5FD99F|nr:DUF5344 family protein [Bacillus sp. CECT 9360]CAH0345445.1 hypothetical protein BCI9360_01731 [Bacillus sp. CECT 9360]
MAEIKVVRSEVEDVFNELKSKINALNTSNPQLHFTVSKLDLTDRISQIEQKYYHVIEQYKNLLAEIEQDAWASIEEVLSVDQELARRIR